MPKFIDAIQETGKAFYQNFHDKGKVTMLNLLKFKENADYSNLEDLDPDRKITGEEAYQLYMESPLPELRKVGSRIIYYGRSYSHLNTFGSMLDKAS